MPSRKTPTDKAAPVAAQPASPSAPGRSGRAPPPVLAVPRRAGAAFLRGGRRIARRGSAAEPIWPRRLDRVVLFVILAVFAAAFLDPLAASYARTAEAPFVGFMRAVTDIGLSSWYLVPTALTVLAVALVDWRRLRHRGRARMVTIFGHAAFVFGAVAATGLAVNVLKIVFGRARPVLFEQHGAFHFEPFTVEYAFASFPSGHATTMGAVTMVLILWFPRYALFIGEIGLFLAATRIAANAHYPSDVVAGFAFGTLFTLVMARTLARRRIVFRPSPGALMPAVIGGRAPARRP